MFEIRQAYQHTLQTVILWNQQGLLVWSGSQLALILGLYILAKIIARRMEPALEARARQIRDNRDLLRVIASTLRRIQWLILTALLLVAYVVVQSIWGRPPGLIRVALALAAAWFFAGSLSRIIRNRLLARTVSWAVWILAALMVVGISDDVAVMLDRFAVPMGNGRLTLLGVTKTLVLLGVALWLAVVTGSFIDRRLQHSEDLTPSMRVLLGKLVKIGLIVAAGTVALSSAGIDLTVLTLLSGAVGVGIGFGLQKVVSNFISGVIILLDKSIKPGDTITVGETFGWIRELRARFVSVVTRDGREYLIPNEDFITQQVVNWSFSDDLVRLDVKFGTSYRDDPHLVTKLAIEAAASVPRVEAGRTPVCWITDFGGSSVNYVLRFWIHDPQQGLTNVRGKVFLALWDTFKANGVELPLPQREVMLKPLPEEPPRSPDPPAQPVRD
jgi:small-conductance mechanosensitive channel